MQRKTISLRVDTDLFNKIHGDNKSETIRNVLTMYYNGLLTESGEIEVLRLENREFRDRVKSLERDKDFLQRNFEILLPKPKRHWWQRWKRE